MVTTATRYKLTTLGGFNLGTDTKLIRLAEKARPHLERGWPVFVRDQGERDCVLEVQWEAAWQR